MDRQYGKQIPEELEVELREFYDDERYSDDAILGIPMASGFYRHKENNRLIPIYGMVYTEDKLLYHSYFNESGEMTFVDIDEYVKESDFPLDDENRNKVYL